MSNPTVLRFGACELHLPRRELKVGGTVRPLTPKVHDLLVLLLQRRSRVVPKRELADALWPGLVLTDSVLARTVMKARRAIDDTAAEPQWIRSIHGVGYRFSGEVLELAVAVADGALPAELEGRRRVAVLPCRNASGDATLDWTQIGLMSLVVHALEGDSRLAPVPVMAMLEALPRRAAALPVAEQAQLAFDALGVEHVVHAAVRRQGASLWLDYAVYGRDAEPAVGSLRDSDAAALAERLADVVDDAVFPGRGSAMRLVSRDPFVNQAYARGMELLSQEQWHDAAPLFAVVCAAEPSSTAALRWHVQCLAMLRDPSAVTVGNTLLERAVGDGDIKMQAIGHALLALAWVHQRMPQAVDASRAHGAAALQLAEGREHEGWVIWHRVHIAVHAVFSDNGQHVLKLLSEAEAACRASGNAYALSQVQRLLAVIELCSGDPLKARVRLEEASVIHRKLRHYRSLAHTLTVLGLVNGSLGLLDAGTPLCDEALSMMSHVPAPSWDCLVLSVAARMYVERGAAEPVKKVLAAFEGIADPTHPLARGPVMAARGCLALCQGDAASARVGLQGAVEHGRAGISNYWVRIWMMLLLRLEIAAGDFVAVAVVCRQMTGLDSFARDVELMACVAHARAAELHAAGEAAEAALVLARIVEETPVGFEHMCARLDAAWLSLEGGDPERAEHWLISVNAWREEHPVGLATQARLLFARGRRDEAAAMQQRALDRWLGNAPEWHRAALGVYAAAAGGRAAALPPLPLLASDSWYPRHTTPAADKPLPRSECVGEMG
jgi:DNA-binding winged helix-turn-helix (wHTH) protein